MSSDAPPAEGETEYSAEEAKENWDGTEAAFAALSLSVGSLERKLFDDEAEAHPAPLSARSLSLALSDASQPTSLHTDRRGSSVSSAAAKLLAAAPPPQKLDLQTATLEECLAGCLYMVMAEDGTLIPSSSNAGIGKSGRRKGGVLDKEKKWIVDASGLQPNSSIKATVATLLEELDANAHRIASLKINGTRLDPQYADAILQCVWGGGGGGGKNNTKKLVALLDVDLAYMHFSFASIAHMCRTVSPVLSGYCPLKRLVLTRTDLGHAPVEQLFNALHGNAFMEELVISGNHCTDSAVPAMVKTLLGSQNRFKMLGLGDNDLSAEGITLLCTALGPHRFIRHLHLQGNKFGDDGAEALFKALRDNVNIETLNLNACDLKECQWATTMRLMESLSTLSIAQNHIHDRGCQNLCAGVELALSLRHLDLSHNLIGGRLSTALGKVLKSNQGLQTLSLSSNTMHFDVWNSLCYGLMENTTLLRLDLTWCDLSQEAAEKMHEALSVNNLCCVIFDMNPLPSTLRQDPRKYSKKDLPEALQPEHTAAGTSLIHGQLWRTSRLTEIKNSKAAVKVLRLIEEEAKARGGDVVVGQKTVQDIGVGGEDEAMELESLSASVHVSPGGREAREMAAKQEQADFEAETLGGGVRVLYVCYGRDSDIIGTVTVNHHTTYAEAKEIIKPLVRSYLGSLGSLTMLDTLVENFAVLDANRVEVVGNELKVRTVWAEASVHGHKILLRPATWIDLPEGKEGDDEEMDEFGLSSQEDDALAMELRGISTSKKPS